MHLPALPSEQRPKVSSRGLGPYGKIGVRKFVRNIKPSKVFIGQLWLVFLTESQPLEKLKKENQKTKRSLLLQERSCFETGGKKVICSLMDRKFFSHLV